VKILINGKAEDIEDNMSILDVLKKKSVRLEAVVVQLNGEIVDRDKYGEIFLKNDDVLEFLYYMGGGRAIEE